LRNDSRDEENKVDGLSNGGVPDQSQNNGQEKRKWDQEYHQEVNRQSEWEKGHDGTEENERIHGINFLLGMNILPGNNLGIA